MGIRKKAWKWILGFALALTLLLAATWFVVFRVNRFSLAVELAGENEVMLEYGEAYNDPGVRAVLRGTLFWQEGIVPENLTVHTVGNVTGEKLGRHVLTYRAELYSLHAEITRQVLVVDTQCPQITLTERPDEEPQVRAVDNREGDISHRIVRTEENGVIYYAVVDSSGNPAYAQWEIPEEMRATQILLEGGAYLAIDAGTVFQDPGFTVTGKTDLHDQVTVEGEVLWYQPGVYTVTYTLREELESEAVTAERTVEVLARERPVVQMPKEKTVYLTFDDGPGAYTQRLLDVLDEYGVKATFFVTDTGCDWLMKEIVDRGHSIGIHTVSHVYEDIYQSPESYFQDLRQMQQIIYDNTGVETNLMRFPGGGSNAISKKYCEGLMTILTEAVQDAGFRYFDWNVDSGDAGGAKTAEKVARNIIDGITGQRVSVVLQHDIWDYSVEAVETVIRWGRDNGYSFKALEETSPGMHHAVFN